MREFNPQRHFKYHVITMPTYQPKTVAGFFLARDGGRYGRRRDEVTDMLHAEGEENSLNVILLQGKVGAMEAMHRVRNLVVS